MLKLALVNPPQPNLVRPLNYYPLGLGYLAASIANQDFAEFVRVDILDMAAWTEQDALRAIEGYDIVGYTSTSMSFTLVCRLAQANKNRSPNTIQIIGGPHVSAVRSTGLSGFDAVFYGEAENSIIQFLSDVFEGRSLRPVYKPQYQPLDELLFPIRTRWEGRIRVGGAAPSASFLVSRGCKHRCAFCASNLRIGRPHRRRSASNVVAEVQQLVAHGVHEFRVWDESFLADRRDAIVTARALAGCGAWHIQARSDEVDAELLAVLKASGCEQIKFGVESFDQRVLDAVYKGIRVEQHIKAIRMAKAAGMAVGAFMLISTPGERYGSTVEANIAGLRTVQDDLDMVTLSTFMPNPGCDVERRPRHYGVQIIDRDYSNYDKHWYRARSGAVSADMVEEAPAWSPLRIDGMTSEQQLDNIVAMRAFVASMPQVRKEASEEDAARLAEAASRHAHDAGLRVWTPAGEYWNGAGHRTGRSLGGEEHARTETTKRP